ncbi:MAG: Na/Pi symporter [Desulfoarculaceae bacterium]|nr:Na/Pi symporter [Desulfoarculaceae bacterium]
MNETFDFWKLIAGLGIFLYGMYQLEDSVKALSGKAFRRIIRTYTNGPLRAIASGALVTGILQSSSAVSLMVLAFIGAGVMTMPNAIGVIMGANIGTTFTAWIVAVLGFKIKIESFALPLIGLGGVGIVFFNPNQKTSHLCRLLIGFGFLFLGLDYMKGSVENIAQHFDLTQIPDLGLWVYLVVGIVLTAVVQSSSASIAIVLTALHSQLITFDVGAALAIGAAIGTTTTVLLGSMGGIQAKKRVAVSHLIFNLVTGIIAFTIIKWLIWAVSLFIDISANSVMGLALFITMFKVLGVIVFFPFIRVLTTFLIRIFPDKKMLLTVYLSTTPPEETDISLTALRKEVRHLLQECQLYALYLLRIDEKLFFDEDLPFSKNSKRKLTLEELYENIKLLHAEIFSYYSKIQMHKLEEAEAKELARVIYASRNIMNSIKNFKGIRYDLDEFDGSDNQYLNNQYKQFRKRLVELYHDIGRVMDLEVQEEQYRKLLQTIVHVEESDKKFVRDTIKAVSENRIKEMEIASLLLVNRLFSQACRLQVFSIKDFMLNSEQIKEFDRVLDMKEVMDEEIAKSQE